MKSFLFNTQIKIAWNFEGVKENVLDAARKMLEGGKLTAEKIAEYAGLSLDEVKRL